MSSLYIYSINQNKCNSCFKCVRECPVNAIRFIGGVANIENKMCVNCGICYDICPKEAVEHTDGVPKVKQLIKASDIIIASLSPNWQVEFRGINKSQMIEALKLLGFTHVSQTSLGAIATSDGIIEHIKESKKTTISVTCPVVVSTIKKYYPNLVKFIAPVEPPQSAHAKMLKNIYGTEAKIIYISSCPAVSGGRNSIDIALTFKELDRWMTEEKIFFDKIPGGVKGYDFEPFETTRKLDYIIPNAILPEEKIEQFKIKDLSCVSYTGIKSVINTLDKIDNITSRKHLFIDLFACEDGCVRGRGQSARSNTLDKVSYFKQLVKEEVKLNKTDSIDMSVKREYHAEDIQPVDMQAEDSILKDIIENNAYPNCEGCGYSTCSKFAKGVILGMTEIENCIMNKKKTIKIDNLRLLEGIRSGVFVIKKGILVDYNSRMANIARIQNISKKSILKMDMASILPFYRDIKNAINNKADVEIEVTISNMIYKITLIHLSNNIIYGFVRNVITVNSSKSEVEDRAKLVIADNIETMQKIAYLLGENAARVEGIIQNILEHQEGK